MFFSGEGQEGVTTVTYNELYDTSMQYAKALRSCDVTLGSRVVGYLPNCLPAIQAMLGTATLGGIWSSTSPDFGVTVINLIKTLKILISFKSE